jgi:hypothetical protein
VPTLVIWGERDQIIPVEHGYGVRAARPGSRLEVLAGLGHFPHVESPTEVASAIEEFIAGSQDAANHVTHRYSQSRGPRRNLKVSEDSKAELRTLFADLKSHKQIEVAVGVLMGCADVRQMTRSKTLSMRSTKPVLTQAISGAR